VILVAGASGRLGSDLVRRLVADGRRVRVLTRDPRRVVHLTGVDVAVGDVRRPGDLSQAVIGVTEVVSAVHGFSAWGAGPATVDRDGNAHLIDAAAGAGAHVVLLSVLDASPTHPMPLFRMKAAAEDYLRSSGVPWTIVRSGAFLELYQELLRSTSGRSGRPVIFGRGDNPITFTPVPDVALTVQRALDDPRCRDQIIEVTGPTMTFKQLAATLTGPGDPANGPRHVPRPVLRLLATASATPLGRQAAAALVMDTHPMAPLSRTQAG
jgi:NADH dehydrogenase